MLFNVLHVLVSGQQCAPKWPIKNGEAIIPAGVTTIPANAFKMCETLKKVTIPSSVTTIEMMHFPLLNLRAP